MGSGRDVYGNLFIKPEWWQEFTTFNPVVETPKYIYEKPYLYTKGLKVNGVDMNKEGNDNMNNILSLFKERKGREIREKYNKIYNEEYDNLEELKRYKELVSNFETSLNELVDEFNREDYRPFFRTGYRPDYSFEISDELMDNIKGKHEPEFDKEYDEFLKLIKEIDAQLSLSEDKDYQIEVLKRYGVLDKSGKMTI